MADKTVSVKFEALTSGYEAGTKRMESATAKFAKSAEQSISKQSKGWDNFSKSVTENSAEWSRAGTAITTFGAVGAAGLGVAGKAAIDWETAWTGVLKTVDGSEAELGALNGALRDMALELPASQAEIAGVAEAAGQLGIQTPNIEGFTRTMIDLGETTNLSANDAATALARFANIMGTSQTEFTNIGSSVVELGNNFATTEREIVEMGLRLAGAGRQAGLTEGEVLGLATSLSSVGIEAQAGGTAFSRVLIEMGVAVDTNSEKLQTFASVAGMTAEQFSVAWEQDAGSAIAAFVSGLGDMEASGQSIQPILEDLGMTDIRVGDALRRASGAADLFTGAMDMGNSAFSENIALSEEAELRYGTVASQLAIARNAATEAAISFGEVLLPAISSGAEAFADFAKWVADLPGPVKEAAVGIGAVATAASLMVGSTLLAVPKLVEMVDTFRKIQQTAPLAATAIKGVGVAAGVMAAAIVADEVTDAIGKWVSRNDDVEQLADAIRGVGDAAEFAETQVAWMTRSGIFGSEEAISGAEALDRFADSAQIAFGDEIFDKLGRLQNSDSLKRFTEDAQGLDATLAELVRSGNSEQAAELFGSFWDRVKDRQGVTLDEVMQGFQQYEEAMNNAKVATEETLAAATSWDEATFPDLAPKMTDNERAMQAAADAAGVYADEVNHLQEQAAEAAEAHDRLVDSILGMYNAATDAYRATSDYEAAIDALTETVKENGETHDLATEAGRNNMEALLSLRDAAYQSAEANLVNGDSVYKVRGQMEDMRTAFIEGAQQLGYTKTEASRLADELGLTSDAVNTLASDIEAVPSKEVDVHVRTEAAKQSVADIQARVNRLTGKTVHVSVITNYSSRGQLPSNRRAHVALASGGPIERAAGGPVYGPGTGTSDSVPAFNRMTGQGYALSNGEHIMTAAEVRAAGGHGEVYRLRKALLANAVRFDVGGTVGHSYTDRAAQVRSAASGPSMSLSIDYDRLAAAIESRPVLAQLRLSNRVLAEGVAHVLPAAASIPN